MKKKDIRKAIARNLNILASDNETIIEGQITKLGLDEEIDRIYIEVIAQYLCNINPDDFTVEARKNTFRDVFTAVGVDTVDNIITSVTGVFGSADVGHTLYNLSDKTKLVIKTYISSTQVVVTTVPNSDWVGDTIYILTPVLTLNDEDLDGIKEITKLEIAYRPTDVYKIKADKISLNNYKDLTQTGSNLIFSSYKKTVYTSSNIELNDKMVRCIYYSPAPSKPDGVIYLTYVKLPEKLKEEDSEPALNVIGVSEVLINGVTAWGLKIQNEFQKVSYFEELNPNLGGAVPRGLTAIFKNYKPNRSNPASYRGFRNN